MRWWKRVLLSVVSLAWGFISLDYLYAAFKKLADVSGNASTYSPGSTGLMQLAGALMFLVWFFIMAIYFWFIKKISPQIDLIEEDTHTGKQKVKKKWMDIILQVAFIITGMMLRWAYVLLIIIK